MKGAFPPKRSNRLCDDPTLSLLLQVRGKEEDEERVTKRCCHSTCRFEKKTQKLMRSLKSGVHSPFLPSPDVPFHLLAP